MSPRLLLGLPRLQGKLHNYAERYQLLEVRPVDTPVPTGGKLQKWRRQVPPAFAFSVVMPAAVARFERGAVFESGVNAALEAATVLQAECILLATPPSLRPTARNRQRIRELAARLPQDGQVLAWEPSGIWEVDDVLDTADAAGLLAVFDGAQHDLPPGPICYTRIRALGHAAQLGADRVERLAHRLASRHTAYVVVDASVAGAVRATLPSAVDRQAVGQAVPQLFRPRAALADGEEA